MVKTSQVISKRIGIKMKDVRTRFAPSPTGYMHIGNLRTAIYEYLIAKVNNGKFILRIEDTDQNRFVPGSTEIIYNTLKSVGLNYDEGPDIGGPYGPYVQSERKPIYHEHAKSLIEKNGAYYCFCSKDRLDKLRSECESKGLSYKYDGHCKGLSPDQVQVHLQSCVPFVIRQKIPQNGQTGFDDLVYGSVVVDNSELDEGVLIKSDGMPTYNFANVIDDHLMEITHVIRGAEYLSSTPKFNLIYNSFNWEIPQYIHLPSIMKSKGKKLSKREGDASFDDFIKKGYLPEAIVNYIILLGWSPGNDEEFFSLKNLETRFTISGLSKSPAIFDETKLKWMNSEYIRKKPADVFHALALPYYDAIKDKNFAFEKISEILQPRISTLSEIPEQLDFIKELPDYAPSLYINKKAKSDLSTSLTALELLTKKIPLIKTWSHQEIYQVFVQGGIEAGLKNSQVFWAFRIALSGKEITPGGAMEIAEILGKEESIKRISVGIEKLKHPD
jgi:glutamyl-tRNA synthetase